MLVQTNKSMLGEKSNHAISLLMSLEEMKDSDFLCDFTIKVCHRSFLVHRAVLAACSRYFKALFSSNMKESRESVIRMQGVEPIAMQRCIEFMYSGEVNLTTDEVQSVIHLSNLLQLENLTDRCLRFLETHITVENCLFTVNMSRLNGRKDIAQSAVEFSRRNFMSVVRTEMFPFVTATDLAYYVTSSNCQYGTLWEAITLWLRCNGNNGTEGFRQVVGLVNPEIFPFNFLFSTALDELVKENCSEGVELVLTNIFSNLPELEMNLNLENCFTLQLLNRSRRKDPNVKSAGNVISRFMASNLDKILDKAEFFRLRKEDLIKLLHETHNHLQEVTIWRAVTYWVGFADSRKKSFSDLFLAVKLENFSCNFIKRHVIGHELVQSSRACQERILRSVENRAIKNGSNHYKVPSIALFDYESSKFRSFEVNCKQWSVLDNPGEDTRRIASVKDKIFALGERLMVFEKNGPWRTAAMLQRQPCPWCQMTCFQGSLYVVEGRNMARYNAQKDEWVEDLPGCALVMGFFLASNEKSLYAMGGGSATKYNQFSNDWFPIAPMRIQRFDASAAVVNEVVYVMGGTLFGKTYNSVECYDPKAQCWADVVSMQAPRSHFTSCVIGNAIFAVGGSKGKDMNKHDDSVEVFDPEKRQWQIVTGMATTGGRMLSCFYDLNVTDIIAQLTSSVKGEGKIISNT